MLVRRPLLLLFVMGVGLSLSSSDRVSLRTTVDGMISFAFLPLCMVLGVGAVYLRSNRRLPFSRVVDGYFESNRPWLLWTLVFVTWETLTHALTISQTGVVWVLATLVVPIVWAGYLDVQFFRVVLSRRVAVADLLLARGISWTLAIGYFFGIALWAQVVAWLR